MVKDMILVDRETLLTELHTVFDPQTADTLLSVLDKVAAQVHAAGVTREDFSELKQIVADLAKAQRQSEKRLSGVEDRLSRLEDAIAKLAEAQRRTEERLERLEQAVIELRQAVAELRQAVAELVTVQHKHENRLHNIEDDLGKLKGYMLESRYRDRTPSYFGRRLRCAKVVDLNTLWDTLEEHLSEEELEEISALDLIITGKPKNQPAGEDLYLAVEVSFVMDEHDVQWARQRAELLQRAGYLAIPVVAGEEITEEAAQAARVQTVVVQQDGRSTLWEEALAQWVTDRSR